MTLVDFNQTLASFKLWRDAHRQTGTAHSAMQASMYADKLARLSGGMLINSWSRIAARYAKRAQAV